MSHAGLNELKRMVLGGERIPATLAGACRGGRSSGRRFSLRKPDGYRLASANGLDERLLRESVTIRGI